MCQQNISSSINNEKPQDLKTIWGKFIVKLREDGFIVLHTAIGEIRDIKLVEDKIIAKVKDDYIYKIITNPENSQKILLEFQKISDKLKVEFELEEKKISKIERNKNALKNLFGEELILKK